MTRRPLGTAAMAAVLVAGLAGCAADAGGALEHDASAVTGGTIRIGLDIEVSSVDPFSPCRPGDRLRSGGGGHHGHRRRIRLR